MNSHQKSNAVAKPHYVSTSSDRSKQPRMHNDEKINELQLKAKLIERKFPAGYQGL